MTLVPLRWTWGAHDATVGHVVECIRKANKYCNCLKWWVRFHGSEWLIRKLVFRKINLFENRLSFCRSHWSNQTMRSNMIYGTLVRYLNCGEGGSWGESVSSRCRREVFWAWRWNSKGMYYALYASACIKWRYIWDISITCSAWGVTHVSSYCLVRTSPDI